MATVPVSDPALLAQLNSGGLTPVTDPATLAQLNGMVTPRGLYHYTNAQGQEVFSKAPPPANATPYRAPTANDSPESDPLVEGAGQAVSRAGLGLRQIGAGIADHFTGGNSSADVTRQIDEAKQTDAALNSTTAGKLGNVAGNIMMVGPFAPAGVAGMIGLGAAQGALQPVGTGDSSRTTNVLEGGAAAGAGGLLGKLLGKVATPVTNTLDAHGQQSVDTLLQAGVPLTVAQRTGSPFLTRLASALKDNPVTAGMAEDSSSASQAAFNRAALRSVGEDASAATSDVMSRAQGRIGNEYERIAAANPVQFDTPLAADLQQVQRAARQTLTDAQAAVVDKNVQNIIDAAARNGGVIDGAAWPKLYQGLGPVTKSPEYGTAARDLRDALVSALGRSAQNPDDLAALRTANEQYQALKQIEGAISPDGRGNISVLKLSNALMNGRNRGQSVYGRGNQDLVDLAQAGRDVLPDALANSGTPARLAAGAVPGVAANAAIDLLSGKPVEAAKVAAFGIAPKYAAPFVYSQGGLGNYLSNGVSNPLARALMSAPNTRAGRLLTQGSALQLAQSLGAANPALQ